MSQIAARQSPWWYRYRATMMGVVYTATFYLAYELSVALHLGAVPIAGLFGPGAAHLIFLGGFVLVLAGWLLRAWGASYLQASVVWNRDALTGRLFVTGPFRYTRNPLYLGNIFMAAAVALLAPPVGWPIVVLGQWLVILALIHEEERVLRERYGAEFDRYCREVPRRLLPQFVPARGDDVPHSGFGAALRTESLMAGVTLTFAAFAIFGFAAEPYAWGFAVAGLLVQYATRTRPLGG